jgi:hypothetical protein
MKLLNLALALVAVGCVHAPPPAVLTEAGERVRVGKSDPDPGLEPIGAIYVTHGDSCGHFGYLGDYGQAQVILRNKAGEQRADYVQIVTVSLPHMAFMCHDNRLEIQGMMFKKAAH